MIQGEHPGTLPCLTQAAHQLGYEADRAGASSVRRLSGAIIAAIAIALLGTAMYLSPDPGGHSTHTQLGMPECRWITLFNAPCPTCGMTTSFSHAVRGDLISSFTAQPMGFVLAVFTTVAAVLGVYVAATGSRIATVLRSHWRPRMIWLLVALLLAAWGFKFLDIRGFI